MKKNESLETAAEVIAALNLSPHPEGGHYREIHRSQDPDGGRGAVTSIYFLLAKGERSHWHSVDACEIWNFHGGAPLELDVVSAPDPAVKHLLGMNLAAGEQPQAIVPPFAWQAARSLGDWTLVGCQVAPAFQFEGFKLAHKDFVPEGFES